MATNEGESSGVPGTEQARPGPGFRRRVVVKFKEHVHVPREDTARALELQGVGYVAKDVFWPGHMDCLFVHSPNLAEPDAVGQRPTARCGAAGTEPRLWRKGRAVRMRRPGAVGSPPAACVRALVPAGAGIAAAVPALFAQPALPGQCHP